MEIKFSVFYWKEILKTRIIEKQDFSVWIAMRMIENVFTIEINE